MICEDCGKRNRMPDHVVCIQCLMVRIVKKLMEDPESPQDDMQHGGEDDVM